MNVKTGDLAILIKSESRNEGKICKVLSFIGESPIINGQQFCRNKGPCWIVEFQSKIRYSTGLSIQTGPCPDAWLRPVSGLPDEQHTEEDNKLEA